MKTYKEVLNKRDPFDRQILKYIKDGTLTVGIVGVKERVMKNAR
ncbi:MAG: hypothetical protein NTW30_02405 [Candidatus Aenigmarchaeota archaeon]|nr:hypothetical protein [Candidatus Aenigmarchaeota archaeon]